MKTHVIVYKAKDGYRWRAKRAGRIVAESGEAYRRCSSCSRSLIRFLRSIKENTYTYEYQASR